jgi:hypothetical protein
MYRQGRAQCDNPVAEFSVCIFIGNFLGNLHHVGDERRENRQFLTMPRIEGISVHQLNSIITWTKGRRSRGLLGDHLLGPR